MYDDLLHTYCTSKLWCPVSFDKVTQSDVPSAARSIPHTDENKQLGLSIKERPSEGVTQAGDASSPSPSVQVVDTLVQ